LNDRCLRVSPIPATSPTLAEMMRVCQLRAGLSRAADSSTFVLGNPKAWLGTAYHEVLEKIASVDFSKENFDAAIEELWIQAIAAQYERAMAHVLDRRFGLPATWPGYYVAKASVTLRARELAAKAVSARSAPTMDAPDLTQAISIREQTFTACDGKLAGKPDVIRAREIVDYKSGAIMEADGSAQADTVNAGYVRQLRIYGFLVKGALGWWPQRGVLLPLAGPGVEVTLNPDQCTREAIEAVAILDQYNAKVLGAKWPDELASPTADNCKWCPFKLICPAFWHVATATWSGQLDGAAVEGVIGEPPRAIHAGDAIALSVNVQSGTEVPRHIQLAPLDPSTHAAAATVTTGDQVRLVGLRARPDGSLVPTQRTVLARLGDLPAVSLANLDR